MLRLDFLNEDYDLDEIIAAYTDGSIDNFKGDEDFLEFLITYSLGIDFEEDKFDEYQKFAKRDGFLNMMLLDEYGYFGKKLYKIYEICNKNKVDFVRVCDLIGKYSIKHSLEKETIDKNLQLKKPVSFFDDSIVLSNGTIPKYNLDARGDFGYDLKFNEELEYDHELERSLRRRINESIRENNDNISLLEEMPSYVEKKRLEEEEKENKKVKDDHLVNINNLFFGSEELDLSGGVLGFNMRVISWFEYTNMEMLNYHIFRSIPEGDYCLLDDNGKIHIPSEILKKDNVSVGPYSPIRSVKIANLSTIFKEALKKMENDSIENEVNILRCKSLLELLENKEMVTVGEIKEFESIIRILYEISFGEIFSDDKDKIYDIDDEGHKYKK